MGWATPKKLATALACIVCAKLLVDRAGQTEAKTKALRVKLEEQVAVLNLRLGEAGGAVSARAADANSSPSLAPRTRRPTHDLTTRKPFVSRARAQRGKGKFDVVIVAGKKDFEILDETLTSVLDFVPDADRYHVVINPADVPNSVVDLRSMSQRQTWKAQKMFHWMTNTNRLLTFTSEEVFPFNVSAIRATQPNRQGGPGADIYMQQLIKLYAGKVLGLKDYLVVDSDLIFYNETTFVHTQGTRTPSKQTPTAYSYAWKPQTNSEFADHIKCVFGENVKHNGKSGAVGHMMLSTHVLEDMFKTVETRSKKPFWQAFLSCALEPQRPVSEYDAYFQYASALHPATVHLRQSRFELNATNFREGDTATEGYDFKIYPGAENGREVPRWQQRDLDSAFDALDGLSPSTKSRSEALFGPRSHCVGNKGYLFTTTWWGNINNQIMTLANSLYWAKQSNRTLIIDPFITRPGGGGLYSFDMFFKTKPLLEVYPCIEVTSESPKAIIAARKPPEATSLEDLLQRHANTRLVFVQKKVLFYEGRNVPRDFLVSFYGSLHLIGRWQSIVDQFIFHHRLQEQFTAVHLRSFGLIGESNCEDRMSHRSADFNRVKTELKPLGKFRTFLDNALPMCHLDKGLVSKMLTAKSVHGQAMPKNFNRTGPFFVATDGRAKEAKLYMDQGGAQFKCEMGDWRVENKNDNPLACVFVDMFTLAASTVFVGNPLSTFTLNVAKIRLARAEQDRTVNIVWWPDRPGLPDVFDMYAY